MFLRLQQFDGTTPDASCVQVMGFIQINIIQVIYILILKTFC